MRDYSDVLAHFRGVVSRPGKSDAWVAFCPVHKGGMERNRSLSLWVGPRGQLMVHCFACGREQKNLILSSVGLKMADLFEDSGKPMQGGRDLTAFRKIVAHYTYTDEQGQPLYRVFRYEPKCFLQGRYDPAYSGNKYEKSEAWKNYRPGVGEARRVLYRLPEIVSPDNADRCVFVVEGEGKVEALRAMGFLATCNVGGAGMGWMDCSQKEENFGSCYSCTLAGRHVVILPDNNPPGYRHANMVAGSLLRHGAASVRYAVVPVDPDKDVGDWVKAGGTREQLIAFCQEHPRYVKG